MRAVLHSTVDTRCDELEVRINEAESTKIAALERELCSVDAVLEKLRAERGVAAEAATSLNDAELIAKNAELLARLDAAEAQLLAIPTSVVELPHVGWRLTSLRFSPLSHPLGESSIPVLSLRLT